MGRGRADEDNRRATTARSNAPLRLRADMLRDRPAEARSAMARRGPNALAALEQWLMIDERRRAIVAAVDVARHQANETARQIGQTAKAGGDITVARAAAAEHKQAHQRLEAELAQIQPEADAAWRTLPNIPHRNAPAQDTIIVDCPEGPTGPSHVELLGDLLVSEQAVAMSGSRFVYTKGDLVRAQTALTAFAIERLTEHGYEPVVPPVLVREHALVGTGFLPESADQVYRLEEDDLYLVGTSEVALASLHAGQRMDLTGLPVRYAGLSSCFRREAGSAGRDTEGLFRVHQFDKIEMFSFVPATAAEAEHDRILGIERALLDELRIPYRVTDIAVDDLGASAARKYDIEAWLPGQARFRELTSCSNTTDYQARRLGIHGDADVHTLNGTAIAMGRTLIALVENGADADGRVHLPECLREFGAPPVMRTGL